jgi:hypothetical protein
LLKGESRLLKEGLIAEAGEGVWGEELLKGKGLLKGIELLKENCQRGIAKEGLIELVGSLQGNNRC